MITDTQSEMIDLYLSGKKKSIIARELNVSRTTIYSWLENDEVKQEIELRKKYLIQGAKDKILNNCSKCIDNLCDLAFNSNDQRVKFNALKYLIDRSLGIPGAIKEEINTKSDNENININSLKAELIELKKLKK